MDKQRQELKACEGAQYLIYFMVPTAHKTKGHTKPLRVAIEDTGFLLKEVIDTLGDAAVCFCHYSNKLNSQKMVFPWKVLGEKGWDLEVFPVLDFLFTYKFSKLLQTR